MCTIANMFKTIRDKVSYVFKNNLIVDYLCCCPCYSKVHLTLVMFGMQLRFVSLGYFLNHDMKLVKVGEDGATEPIDYSAITSDRKKYPHLKDNVDLWVFYYLEMHYYMNTLSIPKDVQLGDGSVTLATPDYAKNDVLLILISGEMNIKIGQWSLKAIFKEGLNEGSHIPYVDKAIKSGYAVMIMNPGDNSCYSVLSLSFAGKPKEHGKYVWDAYVKYTRASKILIVANLNGGTVVSCLANLRKKEFEQRVVGVALLDSNHINSEYNVTTFLKKVSKHWVTSDTPLDTPLCSQNFDVSKVSSGHSRTGVTPYSCMNSVFQFFEEKLSTSQVITEQVTLA